MSAINKANRNSYEHLKSPITTTGTNGTSKKSPNSHLNGNAGNYAVSKTNSKLNNSKANSEEINLEEQFKAACDAIQNLPKNGPFQPSNEMLLKFYAYFKQAINGPCKTAKPSMFKVVEKAKWDAWLVGFFFFV
jgi:acyl-CoA-binding protein